MPTKHNTFFSGMHLQSIICCMRTGDLLCPALLSHHRIISVSHLESSVILIKLEMQPAIKKSPKGEMWDRWSAAPDITSFKKKEKYFQDYFLRQSLVPISFLLLISTFQVVISPFHAGSLQLNVSHRLQKRGRVNGRSHTSYSITPQLHIKNHMKIYII